MINTTNTVNIDGVTLRQFDLKKAFSMESDDNFTRWVVRPLALLAAIGIGVAAFLAGAVLILASLALLPLLAVAMWAMKAKLERDLAAAETTIEAEMSADERGQVAG
jgi:hypothetical protein